MYNLADTTYKTQIFTENGTWVKPEGCVMVMIQLAGAGGGGGGGTPNSGLFIGGGAGGSGGVLRALVPAMFIPNELFLLIGKGGAGGASNTTGSQGGNSAVSVSPISNDSASFLARTDGGNGGVRGQIGGAGGADGGGATAALMNMSYIPIFQTDGNSGEGGTNGGSSAAAVDYTVSASTGFLYSATGGGGRTASLGFKGGDIIGIEGIITTLPGGAGNSVGGDAGGGVNCFTSFAPLFSVGGTGGGGTAVNGAGGKGGDGGFATGGGGGGAGTTFGGAGGNGGNGFAIITCW